MHLDFKQHILPVAIVAAGFALVITLSLALEKARPALPADYADSDLALQGKKLKGYALGAEGLIADWYWILSLQYLGGKIMDSKDGSIQIDNLDALNPRLLYPYLENATELDPHLSAAYSFGAIVLPAIDTRKAIELTEKGIRNNPENWRLFQYLGYIHWKQKDYASAAAVYERGSTIPGAPPFMKQMVAAMNARGGSRETARAIYGQILASAEDEQSKRSAQVRLYELQAQDEIEAVNGVLSEMRSSGGPCAKNLSQLFPKLRSIRLPSGSDFRIDRNNDLIDPSDIPYLFDTTKCEIKIDQNRSTIPISRD